MPMTTGHCGQALATGLVAARFVFPDLDRAPAPASTSAVRSADLTFDERELATAMAASAARAGEAARSAAAADQESELQQTCSHLLEALRRAQTKQECFAETMRIEVCRAVAVFADVCLARIAEVAMAEAMVRAFDRVVDQISSAAPVTIEIAPGLIEPVTALLALRRGGGDSAPPTLKSRADLAAGDVVVCWPDGWAEWSLDRLRDRLAVELGQLPATAGGSVPLASLEPSLRTTDHLPRIDEDAV